MKFMLVIFDKYDRQLMRNSALINVKISQFTRKIQEMELDEKQRRKSSKCNVATCRYRRSGKTSKHVLM
jgi:hypothetical protein